MSKLFDQLKDAARSREENSPGLLVEAMERAKAQRTPSEPGPGPDADDADAVPAPGAPSSHNRFPLAGLALAGAILVAVMLAWHATPWRAPAKLKIDPSELKLDRTLDPGRTSKGTSSPARPS